MANRLKEEEKNERIIRGLLKLPANRRCINCNNLGPQYVCTNFWTFICTNCSGVHREFTHRVKSVSMAKFTSQEVAALQEGGNERAREVYFKEWDPQRNSYPDSSNIDRLRDFIKQVYVNGRYTGGKNPDRTQRTNAADREDYHENRRAEPYRGGSSSPPYEDRHNGRPTSGSRNDDRSLRYNFGERSPGYNQGDSKNSPARFEVVDDRRRDDRFGNGSQNRKFDGHRSPDGPKSEMRSPDQQKKIDLPSPPMVRPVRDILGDDVPKLQVGDPSKTNGTKLPDNSAQTKITSPSSSLSSNDGNITQFKSTGSLIDFSEPEPAVAAAPQQPVAQQTTHVSANGGDWASFDAFTQPKVPQVAANANPLESALAELSAPVPPPSANLTNFPVSTSSPKASGGGQVHMIQQQPPSTFFVGNDLYSNQPSNASTVGTSTNQPMLPQTSQLQGSMPVQAVGLAGNLPRIATTLPQGITEGLHSQPSSADGVRSQPSSAESKSSGRKELPADIFTSLYPPAHMPHPGWQRGPYPVMGYGMQYATGMAMPTVPQSPKTVNPFDITGDSAPQFPAMTSLQGALPNMNTQAALQRSSSLGIPPQQWVPPQQFSYPSAVSPSPYMVQQVPSNIPQQMHVPSNIHQQMHVPSNIPQQMQVPSNIPQQLPSNMMQMGHPGVVGPGNDGIAFGASGMDQNSAARFSLPNTPNSFAPVGGNPFG